MQGYAASAVYPLDDVDSEAPKDVMEGTIASVPPQGGRNHPQQEFLQIDTTDILFVCGGAFNALEKIISARAGARPRSASASRCWRRRTARPVKSSVRSSRRTF